MKNTLISDILYCSNSKSINTELIWTTKQPQCEYIQNLNSNWIYYPKRTHLAYKFESSTLIQLNLLYLSKE